MFAQITDTVFMVRPAAFGFNPQTAASNAFQRETTTLDLAQIQALALQEFQGLVDQLVARGVNVWIGDDTLEPHKPDAIFPNNWISFHAAGQMVTYPMLATQRRAERRLALLADRLPYHWPEHLDLSYWEDQGCYLEGTGSLVLDRSARIAYAALSPRTHPQVLEDFCKKMGYQACAFTAKDSLGRPIYHTNVMMSIGQTFAVVCLESLEKEEQAKLTEQLEVTGKTIIAIGIDQMAHFAGNCLQLYNRSGETILVLSAQAQRSLDSLQLATLEQHNQHLLWGQIPTIEYFGGGSVRCMLAEVFYS